MPGRILGIIYLMFNPAKHKASVKRVRGLSNFLAVGSLGPRFPNTQFFLSSSTHKYTTLDHSSSLICVSNVRNRGRSLLLLKIKILFCAPYH